VASPVRVVFRIMFGDPGRRASAEEKKKGLARWNEIQEEWKNDPGIRLCCYYWTPGRSLDGYSHHYVFEVDDVGKVKEMNQPISMGEVYPFEKYSFEIVFGNEKVDEFWGS
jgi:hypothetical protein